MRRFFVFVLVSFLSVPPAFLQAQVESEYLHWDAGALDALGDALKETLARTEDRGVAVGSLLAPSEARHHYLPIVRRTRSGAPEIHADQTDVMLILEGSGTVVVGGQPMDSPAQGIRGGKRFRVVPGDIVNVPFGTWHQTVLEPGESMTAIVVKVVEG
jgi:mannose-6-phosphate isomerase-like protein (cupin superfamily)